MQRHASHHIKAVLTCPLIGGHTQCNMSNSVKSLSVGYNPINQSDIFTSGDCITGQITLELSKNCKINTLCVKLKGKAQVKWTEHYGKMTITYRNKEKYFSINQVVLEEGKGKWATYITQFRKIGFILFIVYLINVVLFKTTLHTVCCGKLFHILLKYQLTVLLHLFFRCLSSSFFFFT